MRQKYTGVNILWCENFTQGKQMAHAIALYLHMGKFTPWSDQMQILFLQIHMCKFTIMSHAIAK